MRSLRLASVPVCPEMTEPPILSHVAFRELATQLGTSVLKAVVQRLPDSPAAAAVAADVSRCAHAARQLTRT